MRRKNLKQNIFIVVEVRV